ncbi:hypothetical protein CLV24_14117 [Pontibacter ummariensis]|uniref:Uncharacterized protein n=1 Tax=Pontibacter ummariensis TaxID=1610492 RepID=A0A239LEY5_9BACT|nr:hypothetical protein [Pontibacter ummariensis]PRY03385.1 hypothetical protein CLV24_14117 [Pontibacter ummariensis]SNT29197.1 hypothetical protein SAMN06296052_1419 [Pontibacter ummariensis]
MQQLEKKHKPRDYPKIRELAEEVDQVISREGMRRRSVAISLLQEYADLPVHPRLVPSSDGAMEAIIFTLPAYAVVGANNPLWRAYQDLFLKLPTYTTLYLLVHETVKEEVQNWLEKYELMHRTMLQTAPERYEMTIWAEDEYEPVYEEKEGKFFMVQPHTNRRTGDERASYLIGQKFGWSRARVPVYFEGGNMLVGDDFLLVGANYAVDTYTDLREQLLPLQNFTVGKAISQLFQKYLDKERAIYFIGSTLQIPAERRRTFYRDGEEWQELFFMKNTESSAQPIFHIDMFISLAGRGEEGKYRVLVGDPRMAADSLQNDHDDLATPEVFDDIADLLTQLGFDVIRNPLPLVYVDDEAERVRKWYFATSNNALVEVKANDEKTVWLPSYGHGNWQELEKTDQENKAIWQQLGFNVILLENFHPFAEHNGAVHCIKKYLKRGRVGE